MWRNWMNYFFPKKVEQLESGSESTPTDKLDNLEKQIDNDSPPSSPIHIKEPEPYQVIEDRNEKSVHVPPAELESIVPENPVEHPTTWDPNEFTDSEPEPVVEPEPEPKPVVEPEPEPEPVVEPETNVEVEDVQPELVSDPVMEM